MFVCVAQLLLKQCFFFHVSLTPIIEIQTSLLTNNPFTLYIIINVIDNITPKLRCQNRALSNATIYPHIVFKFI